MLILKDISVILIFEEMNYFQVDIIRKKNKSPRRGIEPRSGTRQAPILTIKLSRINDF